METEWVINNAYKKTKEGLERIGLMNSHAELDQEILGQLAAIGEYLVTNGLGKVIVGPGIWMTHKQLDKEKKDFVHALLSYWEEHSCND